MSRLYMSAPLPFVGQKRMFAKYFIDIIKQYPDGTLFVDLFGGSGLLSHITRHFHPNSKVVYNDFDGYRLRIAHIGQTNRLLRTFRAMVTDVPRHKPIPKETRGKIYDILDRELEATGYLDYITLSSSLMFSMKYRMSVPEMRKEVLYNNIRTSDYLPCDDYLEGLDVVSCDYSDLFDKYRDVPGVVFIVDPPYLSTDVGTYRMYWRLADYLDVLSVLPGHNFIYFTSQKSSIVELCEWMGRNPSLGNPFEHCLRKDFHASVNYSSRYTDIMLYTPPK